MKKYGIKVESGVILQQIQIVSSFFDEGKGDQYWLKAANFIRFAAFFVVLFRMFFCEFLF